MGQATKRELEQEVETLRSSLESAREIIEDALGIEDEFADDEDSEDDEDEE